MSIGVRETQSLLDASIMSSCDKQQAQEFIRLGPRNPSTEFPISYSDPSRHPAIAHKPAQDPYLFQGVVVPERAQISFRLEMTFAHIASGRKARAILSVILNQIAVWIYTEDEWNIHDLRNVVVNLVRAQLEIAGYVLGRAYECEITRLVSPSRGIDYVFGIEIDYLAKRTAERDRNATMDSLRSKTGGEHGVYVRRSLGDLAAAMKYPDDTGFYCYRAVEALRLHCAALNELGAEEKSKQWEVFRGVSDCSEGDLRELESAARSVRHGDIVGVSGADRERLLTLTWDIVDKYLATLPSSV